MNPNSPNMSTRRTCTRIGDKSHPPDASSRARRAEFKSVNPDSGRTLQSLKQKTIDVVTELSGFRVQIQYVDKAGRHPISTKFAPRGKQHDASHFCMAGSTSLLSTLSHIWRAECMRILPSDTNRKYATFRCSLSSVGWLA